MAEIERILRMGRSMNRRAFFTTVAAVVGAAVVPSVAATTPDDVFHLYGIKVWPPPCPAENDHVQLHGHPWGSTAGGVRDGIPMPWDTSQWRGFNAGLRGKS